MGDEEESGTRSRWDKFENAYVKRSWEMRLWLKVSLVSMESFKDGTLEQVCRIRMILWEEKNCTYLGTQNDFCYYFRLSTLPPPKSHPVMSGSLRVSHVKSSLVLLSVISYSPARLPLVKSPDLPLPIKLFSDASALPLLLRLILNIWCPFQRLCFLMLPKLLVPICWSPLDAKIVGDF